MRKNLRIWIYSLVVIGVFLMLTNSCKKDDANNNPSSSGTVQDIDGNVYHTVTIGTQVWMVENLKTTKYRNGEQIPAVTDNAIWGNLTTGAQCNYKNDAAIGIKYGKLYNWYAVNDSRNIAPTGWHVPTDDEWTILETYVAANVGTSHSVAKALAANSDWATSTKVDAIGNDLLKNNSSGFSALPGGGRFRAFGDIANCVFWSSSEPGVGGAAWGRDLDSDRSNVDRFYDEKYDGFSVRCVRD